ncbi:Uncharacterized protein FWK35_00016313 [Aphis craccivora]|uniref:Uncharacterized protein n=1 Tax=Aphis craccivora TaxID=307492 RepID=A0A6G0Y014_APHCR|nr:Uncharacterized protein FWK35_00016313 [Aphis craccivora]
MYNLIAHANGLTIENIYLYSKNSNLEKYVIKPNLIKKNTTIISDDIICAFALANGRTIFEFVTLRAKSYAFDVEHKVSIRAKGVMRHVIKNYLTLNDHKRCLFASDTDDDIEDGESDIELGVHASKLLAIDAARQVVERIHRDA